MKTARQFRKMRVRNKVSDQINSATEKGFKIEWLTPFQCRVNYMLDIYPTNRKYHNLLTGERGMFADVLDCMAKHAEVIS